MFFIKDSYITDTYATDYKYMDGKISQKTNNMDKTCDGDLLCYEDKSVLGIFDEEKEYSWSILLDCPYGLITYSDI